MTYLFSKFPLLRYISPLELSIIRLSIIRLSIIGLPLIGVPQTAIAQVTADGTLPTQVTQPTVNHFVINGGARGGNNLFHSFSQFSIPTGGSAIFQNFEDVKNIFSRVTGSNVSNIDGLLQAQGRANLFLLNPNGILFGPNAKLQIGGSFLGTTANSIRFADGIEFSTTLPDSTPLLSISLPIGLQMGRHPRLIEVHGDGHHLMAPETLFAPYLMTQPERGLTVPIHHTLALVGGAINLNGGLLSAEGGRIELAAIASSSSSSTSGSSTSSPVKIDWTNSSMRLNYNGTSQFGDIHLAQRSLLNVSGAPAGAIQVQGNHIRLQGSSALWSQNRGAQAAGTIRVQATGNLLITGNTHQTNTRSDILSETLTPGASGNIDIFARQVNIRDGGGIRNRSFGSGDTGSIHIQARERVNLYGTLETDNINRTAQIAIFTAKTGDSEEIQITTPLLELNNAGFLVGSTFGQGAGSTITVNADTLEVNSVSYLESGTYGPGRSGNLVLNTRRLTVTDGARVSTAAFSTANAGNVTVNATESIDVRGGRMVVIPALEVNEFFPSRIMSSAPVPYLVIQRAVGLGSTPSGDAGRVLLNTPSLNIGDRGMLGVLNEGIGNGGLLEIHAGTIRLTHQGAFTAATRSGRGGDISIDSNHLILLRHGSKITATASNSGNGGNITIDAPLILGLENSDLIANAVQGRGGNIDITTQGIIGLEFRDTLTPRTDLTNDITASSQFSVNGTVQINNIGVDPHSGLIRLPENIVDSTQQLAKQCNSDQESSLILTGLGGMPTNPTQDLQINHPWDDLRLGTNLQTQTVAPSTQSTTLVEATTWWRNPQTGEIELVNPHFFQSRQPETCSSRSSFGNG